MSATGPTTKDATTKAVVGLVGGRQAFMKVVVVSNGNVKLTAREAKIVALKAQGMTYQQIVAKLDLPSHVTVYQALAKAGKVTSRGSQQTKLTPAVKAELIRMKKAGATYMQMAVKFGLQPPQVNKVLREAGLTKPRSTATYEVEDVADSDEKQLAEMIKAEEAENALDVDDSELDDDSDDSVES